MALFHVITVLSLIGGYQVLGDLREFPENVATVAGTGTTVVLRCAANRPLPQARIMWNEFATSTQGSVVSDNRGIVSTHPNAARYSIIGNEQTNEFHLQITGVTKADGGAYLCQDLLSGSPAIFRRFAELIVFETNPVCRSYSSTGTGNVFETVEYNAECAVNYQGNLVPHMEWFGPPGLFYTNGTRPPGSVWSYLSFTALRSMEGQFFFCNTNFTTSPVTPGYAENIPTFLYHYEGPALIVNWAPTNMQVSPLKPTYEVGETLTCTADAKPSPSFQWSNQRVLQPPLPPGPTFLITQDLYATNQSMRCQASNIIEGMLLSNDIFIPLHVPEITTTVITTPAPTTTPPAVSNCEDLSGRWVSTNPSAMVCIDTDAKGNLVTLIRNGTDLFFGTGRGKTVVDDNSHVGFTTLWPLGGAAGFCGECHRCVGNEVLLMSGITRNKLDSPSCGVSAGTHLTNLYVFTRAGTACIGMTVDEVRTSQPWILDKMGIKAKKILPL